MRIYLIIFILFSSAYNMVSFAKTNSAVEVEAQKKHLRPYIDYHPEMDSLPVEVNLPKLDGTSGTLKISYPDLSTTKKEPKLSISDYIAVTDFVGQNVSVKDAIAISNYIRSELVTNSKCIALKKENMDTILEKRAVKTRGCATLPCAQTIGKVLNVKKIIVGALSKSKKGYTVSVNLVDVETGSLLIADKAEAPTIQKLKTSIKLLIERISL